MARFTKRQIGWQLTLHTNASTPSTPHTHMHTDRGAILTRTARTHVGRAFIFVYERCQFTEEGMECSAKMRPVCVCVHGCRWLCAHEWNIATHVVALIGPSVKRSEAKGKLRTHTHEQRRAVWVSVSERVMFAGRLFVIMTVMCVCVCVQWACVRLTASVLFVYGN